MRKVFSRMSRGEGPRDAFTLVELLVVIAIISILAAMLLPALEHALGSARQAACASNQKQIATGFVVFTGENDGRLPPTNGETIRTSDGLSGQAYHNAFKYRWGWQEYLMVDAGLHDGLATQATDEDLSYIPGDFSGKHRLGQYVGFSRMTRLGPNIYGDGSWCHNRPVYYRPFHEGTVMNCPATVHEWDANGWSRQSLDYSTLDNSKFGSPPADEPVAGLPVYNP